jgi:Flp pilus assembly protein TadD
MFGSENEGLVTAGALLEPKWCWIAREEQRSSANRFDTLVPVRALILLIFLCSLAAEGASRAQIQHSRASLVAQIEAQGLDPAEIVFPDALTEEMKGWLEENVKRGLSDKETIDRLLSALTEPDGLGLVYIPGHTGTAEEVFRTGKANCLAFTHLLIGMSRELGIQAYYVNYELAEQFRRSGDLIVVSGHVSAGYGTGADRYLLEFGVVVNLDGRRPRPISDLNALARYYANRAAELLRAGRAREALGWAETATRLDPTLVEGWSNLGVALRRSGHIDEAEQAYLKATEIDPYYHVAYHNLFALMRFQGQSEAADQILDLLDRRDNRNPFIYLELGDQSLAAKRLDEAGDFYKRATKVGQELAETWAARGSWALASDKVRKARRWLRKAQSISPDDPRTVELERHLLEFEGVVDIESSS